MIYNADMNAPLTSHAILALCQGAAATVAVEVVAETGSTNADLLARIPNALAAPAAGTASPLPVLSGPTLRLALQQNAGRGRAGRTWHSDGISLTFSLAWRFRLPLTGLVGLPLAVGVAVADVLAAGGNTVSLKWPNDVLHDGRKLAGILIETASHTCLLQDASWAVIGIGINLGAVPAAHASASGAGMPATALQATDRNALMANLLTALVATLTAFADGGFEQFIGPWNTLHAHAGQLVNILEGPRVLHTGRALGVDGCGRLLLDTGHGTVAVLAGDVSLRSVDKARHAAAD